MMILERLKRLERSRMTLIDWCYRYAEIKVGPEFRPFSFYGHEYLRELYEDPFPRVVLEKAAQMGATQYGLFRSIWFADTRGATVLYFFDTDIAVVDFSNKRVKPLLERSEYLSGLCDDINNVHMRKLGNGWLCFRGMFSPSRVRSIDADHIVLDELDVAQQINREQAHERLSHSPWRWWLELSTPTTPNRGVDRSWQESDQRYWHVACGCREGTVLEDNWPECIGVRREGTDEEEVFLRCPKCGKERLNPCEPAIVGEYRGWIPRRPEISLEVRGYHLSQLFGVGAVPGSNMGISLREIWHAWKHTKNIPEFYNSKLGLPYAGDRVPIRELAHGDWGLATTGRDVKIGIDQGDEIHIVVLKVDPNTGERRVINAIVVEGEDPWPETVSICRMYRDPVIVIDAMPNKHDARRLCDAFPGRAFMCYYSETQKDAIQVADDGDTDSGWKVVVNRTETLDRLVDGVNAALQGRNDGIVFPHAQIPVCGVLRAHLQALVRLRESEVRTVGGIRRETGEQRVVYTQSGPDHFAHALNYANIAASIDVYPGELTFL